MFIIVSQIMISILERFSGNSFLLFIGLLILFLLVSSACCIWLMIYSYVTIKLKVRRSLRELDYLLEHEPVTWKPVGH